MATMHELGEQILKLLERKLETKYRRQARGGGGQVEPGLILGELSSTVAQEIVAQETKCREKGDEAAAQAFAMVRTELLGDVIRDLHARLTEGEK